MKAAELQVYGLNGYEAQAYLALVQSGVSTAHEASRHSSVPYGKIYPVLAALEQKGFVKSLGSVPKRFMAVEPKIAIEQVLQRREQEMKMLKQKATSLIHALGTFSVQKPKESLEQIRIIEGYRNYLNLSVALHEKARQEWLTISELSVYKPHIDAYRNCIRRGVKVKVLTSKEEVTPEKLSIWKRTGAEIRISELHQTKFSVIDNAEVTIRITGEERYLSLWIRNNSLANSMRNAFLVLWKKGKKA